VKLTGSQAFLKVLADLGVPYLFGNPGTTELPLMDDMITQDAVQFRLGLHEIPIMTMAEGYSQASRKLSCVNLHTACGLGNAMGMLFNSHIAGTPILVTAGQQDRKMAFEEPVLWGESITEVAKPWCKWSYEIQHVKDIPHAVRRAARIALSPPTGPVFLSLPLDIQMETYEFDWKEPKQICFPSVAEENQIKSFASFLLKANSPVILAGSRIVEQNGLEQVSELAHAIGAKVFTESATSHGRLGYPPADSLASGNLPLWSKDVADLLDGHDTIIGIGIDMLRLYIHQEPEYPFPPSAALLQIDSDDWQLAKNYEIEHGLLGNIKASLGKLNQIINETSSEEFQAAAKTRVDKISHENTQRKKTLIAQAESEYDLCPMTSLTLMDCIAKTWKPKQAIIEEAVTTTSAYLERAGIIQNADGYFAHKGWALGWGMGTALGVKLAWPDRPVLAILGDGASMYGIQGLWSAVKYNIPVTFIICQNGQYQILKDCAHVMDLPQAQQNQFLGMDLTDPQVDYVTLAQSFGMEAKRIETPDELMKQLEQPFDHPRLIEIPVQRPAPDNHS
jgi:benzoylformate decarboxylase